MPSCNNSVYTLLWSPLPKSAAYPIHSVPSIVPEEIAGTTSGPGNRTTFVPKLFKTSPPNPGILNFKPLKSSDVKIFVKPSPHLISVISWQKNLRLNSL